MSEENINAMEIEESFADMLEKSIKTLNTGDKVTGVVTGITATEVNVDLGTKHAGYIPLSELSDDPSVKPEDIVKVGDEIETYVMRVNDVEGVATLSKKRLDSVKNWDTIEAARGGEDHPGRHRYRGEQGRHRGQRQGHPGVRPRLPDRQAQRGRPV